MNSKLYDALKWVALTVLPASATFYAALAALWGFPYVLEVVGTITAFDTFLGIILGISSVKYVNDPKNYAGSVIIGRNEDEEDVAFLKTSGTADWSDKKTVSFKVQKIDSVIPAEPIYPDYESEEAPQ